MTVICSRCSEKRAYRDCLMKENKDHFICYFCLRHYQPTHNVKDTKALKKCDIFTLNLNEKLCDYSFVEWGKAKEMNKVLVLINEEGSDSYNYLVHDSKKSFKHLSEKMRDMIIQRHHGLKANNYTEYKTLIENNKTENRRFIL